MHDNSLEKEQLRLEEKDEEIKIEFLKEVKSKQDNNRFKSAEINFNRNLESDYSQKIEELNKKIDNVQAENNFEKVNNKNYYLVAAILIITFIVLMFVNKFKLVNTLVLLPLILVFYKKFEAEKKVKENAKNIDSDREKIAHEIEVLKENQELQKKEAEAKQEKLTNDIEREKEELIEKYTKFLDIGFMEENLSKNYDEILKEIDKKENRLNTIKIR